MDRNRKGGKHQDGMTPHMCGPRACVEPDPHQHRNSMAIFRRDTPAEAEFRMNVRTWLEANLPVALRGRNARPPPAELMPWYQTLSRKGWIAPHGPNSTAAWVPP